MRAYLAAIGCKGEEISWAHLATIGCNGLIHLQAFQSLKLDSTGIQRSRSVYSQVCGTGKILEYCSCHIHVLLKKFFPDTHKIKTMNPQGLKM